MSEEGDDPDRYPPEGDEPSGDELVLLSPEARAKRRRARKATDRLNELGSAGSVIQATQHYERYYSRRDGAEPGQDDEEMRLVRAALARIHEEIEQIDITDGHTAILMRDGNRTTLTLDIGDTPENLELRLRRALAKIPVRYPDAEVAQDIEKCFSEDVDPELLVDPDAPAERGKKLGLRIERGGLE